MQEALHYRRLPDNKVHCQLCPQGCHIADGRHGLCRMRQNRGGRLYAFNYGLVSAAALDPMEKKPLYHFYPGSLVFSLGTLGCNLRCGFCQNWHIAQTDSAPARYMSPQQVVQQALVLQEREAAMVGIAYTYSEPLMWYEFVLDTARLARKDGLKNVLVTNGYINRQPLQELLPYIDAMNIDLKGATDEFYRQHCAGRLESVKETIQLAAAACHVEVTTLLIGGVNDSPAQIEQLARFLAGVDRRLPWHLSRYFPNYQFDLPPTPLENLRRARQIAREYLDFVYVGNAPELDGSDTVCPRCGHTVIARRGYLVDRSGLAGSNCRNCGELICHN
ncbi:AmmeMemoRadiSam system radical SAM enzyme [Desulfurispora thermophila]|uniref:AmmeMemoRadiSam system radical SAM enzyme n=1 Tax=Desulfurispora thermophila TaxID=265470 RepID=UPI00037C90F2|nr:AmmeMemoRadiSam system radical SAM enzyme [Desulfurispora thermophila]